jgi:hypothetical protein
MPAGSDLTFERSDGWPPMLSNSGDIAFPAAVKNGAGNTAIGVFFLGRDGQLQSVAVPGQELPGGGNMVNAVAHSLNDAGGVAFVATTQPNSPPSAYLWEKGSITPVALLGMEVPGGGKIAAVDFAAVNNKNRSVLVLARLRLSDPHGFYLWEDGKLTPLLVRGQEMPGGGQFREVLFPNPISYPNEAGQYAFLARVTEAGTSRTAAYLMDADGKLSLILKSGTTTDLGRITHISVPTASPPSSGVAVNSKGQVALPVRIDNGPTTLVLLTPAGP